MDSLEQIIDEHFLSLTDLNKRQKVTPIQSKDELEKLSTPEYFTEVDKANYLLDRGLSEQKAWVISSLPSLLREQGGEQVLKKIIVTFT